MYLQLADESVGTNDIKSSNTENTIGIVHAGFLKYFACNGDSAVNLLSKIAKFNICCGLVIRKSSILFTGLEMIPINALGQTSAAAIAKSRTIEALMLNRSSRVIPGLRETPAGMMSTSTPSRELYK